MGRGIYIGVGDKARKVKNIYIGIDGKARKVKKAYIGINGVARLFFKSGSGTPAYYGATPTAAYTAMKMAAAPVGNYGIFAGGSATTSNGGAALNTACAYNKSLVKSSLTALSTVRSYHAGAPVGNYALFAGGGKVNGSSGATSTNALKSVETYSSTLTKSAVTSANELTYARNFIAGASVGTKYAIFLGGTSGNSAAAKTTVDSYNDGLTKTQLANTSGMEQSCGVSNEKCAFFAGGRSNSNAVSTVYKYDGGLTRTNTNLSASKTDLAGAYAGNYVIYAGGRQYSDGSGGSGYTTVDAFDMDTMTRTSATVLAKGRWSMGSLSVGDVAFFIAGIHTTNTTYSQEVTTYNDELTQVLITNFPSTKSEGLTSVTVGDYGLITGDLDLGGAVYAYTAN